MDEVLRLKRDALHKAVSGMESVVVAYSGGVDSSCLSAVCHERLGDRSLAVTAVSPSLARRELDAARALARRFGWAHRIVGTRELDREDYLRNDPDRCYWCKSELYEVLAPIARDRNATVLVGTNVDDLGDHRPGGKAARERGVRAPFVEAGLTKGDVRALAAALGLPTADKPASPCLSSRIAYGIRVTPERLRRIERAEDRLIELGFEVMRVRDHGDLARIEVPAGEVTRAAALREEIVAELRDLGWKYVTLDLGGFRSGSMNEVLPAPVFLSKQGTSDVPVTEEN
jgi:pyridinium-3,5-biscarboxylic acid mononucleotide sulfurtransferase